MHRPGLLAALALCAGACAGTDYRGASQATLRPLEEVRAQRVIEGALRDRGLRVELQRHMRVLGRRDLEIDAAIAGARFGIEFVTAADRATLGSAVPRRTTPDALVVVPGAEGDRGGEVLVLDDQDFLYEPDPNRQGPGHPVVQEVEDRLYRAVVDYVTYLRDHHRL